MASWSWPLTTEPTRLSTGVLAFESVFVASPYVVFRAADWVWPLPSPAAPVVRALGSPSVATPSLRSARSRKRPAPVGVIQGELFAQACP